MFVKVFAWADHEQKVVVYTKYKRTRIIMFVKVFARADHEQKVVVCPMGELN